MSDELKMIERSKNVDVIAAYNRIPYALINAEVSGYTHDTLQEFTDICRYYKIYDEGSNFSVEGTNNDYVAATLHYRMSAGLIDKQARFLFAESPTISVEAKGDLGKVSDQAKDALTVMNDLVRTVLDANKFDSQLVKAARDCFIGKRVAGMVNFNEEEGVTITFLPSTQFIYETRLGNPNVITKFVAFMVVHDSMRQRDKRIFKKKYDMDADGVVYVEEMLFDGAGGLIEEVTPRQQILLDVIPAVVILNDGLTGDLDGESEIKTLADYESWYSKLSNADIDAERKSMNPVTYTVDMDSRSTQNLSRGAGSYWDLGSDQNLEKPNTAVGQLEPSMNYSSALETTLNRVKTTAYEQIDMPNLTLDSMTGVITSGKALKAIYWPLIVRCKEKMATWGPQLQSLVDIIIRGAQVYPNTVARYTNDVIMPVAYEVKVEQNTPLPEDEQEEKQLDMSEVLGQVRSRKSYMKKWHGLTDDEIQEELEQMALERQILEDSAMLAGFQAGSVPYPESVAELSVQQASGYLEDGGLQQMDEV